ncbi:MAG: Chromosome-partitioning protein Spo0J [Syntrophorhabdus sp. PtaU1.Bin153]|nr:MAG: Chromosome-partitioning protein Spo0J [Syntrophorhabdus sp. PtaU1.Bin153]
MKKVFPSEVQMIPIRQIDILNPRLRDQKDFSAIVANISNVGLKKPITVAPRRHTDPQRYYLACGQGRMEAFIALAQEAIPAFVIDASEEECMIMSLVENLARRQHQPLELFQTIAELKSRGYSNVQIGKKIGMSDPYVGGFVHLLENGEEGLIRAVANGNIPISVAMDIAGVERKDAMEVLQKGYESGQLRGAQFLKAKRIISMRLCWGKKIKQPQGSKGATRITSKTLIDTIQREAERQRFLVRESRRAKRQILFVETAMRKLRSDMGFVNLLRALKLDSMPELLDERTR